MAKQEGTNTSNTTATDQTDKPKGFTVPEAMEMKSLITRIATFGKTAKELIMESVILAKEALVHFHKHGDVTAATALVQAMPEGFRRKALIAWFKVSAPLAWTENGDIGYFSKDKTSAKAHLQVAILAKDEAQIVKATKLIQRAFEKPYYEMWREQKPVIELFDEKFVGNIDRLLKQYDDMNKEGLVQQTSEFQPLIESLRDIRRKADTLKSSVDSEKKKVELATVNAKLQTVEEEETSTDTEVKETKAA